MTFFDLVDNDVKLIEAEIRELVQECELPYENIRVSLCSETNSIEFTANVSYDPILSDLVETEHRSSTALVRTFVISPDDESEVVWGQLTYSVPKDRSHFFPVPEKYGDHVTVEYGWEFERDSLELHGPAQIRDLDRLHYISVVPNPNFASFVGACVEISEGWTDQSDDEE